MEPSDPRHSARAIPLLTHPAPTAGQVSEKVLEAMQGSLEELDLYKGVAAGANGGDAAIDKGTRNQQFRRLLLLIIAITIHNFPEVRPAHDGYTTVTRQLRDPQLPRGAPRT